MTARKGSSHKASRQHRLAFFIGGGFSRGRKADILTRSAASGAPMHRFGPVWLSCIPDALVQQGW